MHKGVGTLIQYGLPNKVLQLWHRFDLLVLTQTEKVLLIFVICLVLMLVEGLEVVCGLLISALFLKR